MARGVASLLLLIAYAEANALMMAGGLWLALWRTRLRLARLLRFAVGALWALITPAPDLLISGDGQHLAVRTPDGGVAMLRDKAGDYARDTMAENAGVDGEVLLLSEQPFASCTRDACLALVTSDGRTSACWRRAACSRSRSGNSPPLAAHLHALMAQARRGGIATDRRGGDRPEQRTTRHRPPSGRPSPVDRQS
jgi:competence protein ComEC